MIHRLSEEVKAALRTGVALTSFAQAVEELVLNSIDAGATSVAIRVDLQCFKIQIVDNGTGITQEQFPLIGERYATSKCKSLKDLDELKYFGYRGEALASLRSAATFLEIISRARSSGITFCKCFHNGKPSNIMESTVPRPSAGTTITAHNLFYNLPVRQKHLNEGLEMERVRFHVAALAIMWPYISFSLRDDSVGHVILQTCKSNSIPMSLSTIFPVAKSRNLKELSITDGEFKIYGVVCTDSYSRKDLQFVYVNKRLVLKSSIHHQMNKIIGRSLILRKKGISYDVSEKSNSGFVTPSSPVKQSERYGIFVINVDCPYSAYDITFEPRKTLVEFKNWPKLIHLIQDLIYGFLRKENLLSLTDPPLIEDCREKEKDEERNQIDGDSEREESEDGTLKNNNCKHNDNKSMNRRGTSPVLGAKIFTDVPNALFSKTVCRPKVPKDSLDTNSSVPIPGAANQNVAANAYISLSASQREKRTYLFRHKKEEFLPCHSYTESKNLHNRDIVSEKHIGLSEYQAHNVAHNIHLNAIQRGSVNLKHVQSTTNRHQVANDIDAQTDHSEIPLPLSRLNRINDPEEVYARKQMATSNPVREITLGKSIHYHSTLKRLRDSDETSLGRFKASGIITNTLQQLRQSAQETGKNLGDSYKTPVAPRADVADELQSKQPRMEVKTYQANTDVSRYEATNRKTTHHDESSLLSQGVNMLSGPNKILPNRGIGQKRLVEQNVSQATKLAKLMTGKKVTGDVVRDEPKGKKVTVDVHWDRPNPHSSKHSALLRTFTYSKQIQDDDFHQKGPQTYSNSSYVSDADAVYVKNKNHLSELSANDNESHSPSSTASRLSHGKNTSGDWTSLKQIPNDNLNSGGPACQDDWHSKSRTKNNERCMAFSMCNDCKHRTWVDEVGTPKVSLVLSLPIEHVSSETIQTSQAKSSPVSKCPTTAPLPFSVYTPQGLNVSLPQILFQNTSEILNHSCDGKSVLTPCLAASNVGKLSQGFSVKNVCSNLTQTKSEDNSQGFHLENHHLLGDSIDCLKDKVSDLVDTEVLNTPTISYSCTNKGSEMFCVQNVCSHSGFASGGFSLQLNSFTQERSESSPVHTSGYVRDKMNHGKEMNELPYPDVSDTYSDVPMCDNANGAPIQMSSVDDTHDQTVGDTSEPLNLACLATQSVMSTASQTLTSTIGQLMNWAVSKSVDSTHDQSNAQHFSDQHQDFEYFIGDQYGMNSFPNNTNSQTSSTSAIINSLPELEKCSFSSYELHSNPIKCYQYIESCSSSNNLNEDLKTSKEIKSSQLAALAIEVGNSKPSTQNNFVAYKPRVSMNSRLFNMDNSSNDYSTTAEHFSTYFSDKCKSIQGDAVSNGIHKAASDCPLHWATESLNAQSIGVVQETHCQIIDRVTSGQVCDKDFDLNDDSKNNGAHCSFLEKHNCCGSSISNAMASNACSTERDSPLNTGQVQAVHLGVTASPNTDQQVNNGSESLFGNTENLKTQANTLSSNNLLSISEKKPVSETTFSVSNSYNDNDSELIHSPQTQSKERNPLPGPGIALPNSNISESHLNDMSLSPLMQINSNGFSQQNLMCLEVTGSNHRIVYDISECKEHVSQLEKFDLPAVSHAQHISHVNATKDISYVKVMEDISHMNVTEADNKREQLQSNLEQGEHDNKCSPQTRIPIVSVSKALNVVDYKPQPLKVLREQCQKSFNKKKHSDAQVPTEVVPLRPELVQNLNVHCNTPVQSFISLPSQSYHVTRSSEKTSCDGQFTDTNDMHWQEISDSTTGRRLYINNESGHTLSEDQWTEMTAQGQELDKSGAAVPSTEPEPLSAQLTDSQKLSLHDMVNSYKEHENYDTLSKWRGGDCPVYEKEIGTDISTLMSKWTNPVFLNYKQPAVNAEMCPTGQTARSCFNSLSLVEFTKDMLTNVKVIGQIDCKFIACLIQKSQMRLKATSSHRSLLLVLFDQHAVHERIRLEEFTRETYEILDGVRSDKIKRSDLSPPHPLTMELDDLRLMKAFNREFNRIGVTFVSDNTCRNVIHITSAPVCLTEKDSADTKRKTQSLPEKIEQLIKEHIQLIKSTNGACGRLPLTIHKILCSQACHGAVKFGDKLTLGECQDLLSALSSCDLPFQCAHGRPSVAPLVDVTALEQELSDKRGFPKLSKISANIHQ